MCGIAGIFDVNQSKELNRSAIAAKLLCAIEARGKHAAGYAYHDQDTTIVCKADLPASEFVEAAPMFTDPFDRRPRTILLHARYATQGLPTNNYNNHPIYSKVTGLTLIHNGWLTNERALIAKYGLRKDGEVDSETVLRLIEHFVLNDKKRITTAIRLAMAELEGKFACALISEKHPDAFGSGSAEIHSPGYATSGPGPSSLPRLLNYCRSLSIARGLPQRKSAS
jgi:glucosamine 6-phosphate synthetase-like amidotransferase/phosphosugar isomerase protein